MLQKSHEYYLAVGNPDGNGDAPCVILSEDEINIMLVAGYVEHVETQPDKSLMKFTKKFMDEIAMATRH